MATANHQQYSFVPDPHTSEYLAMNDRSPSPARKLWPFNRSRSSSPNTQGQLGLSLDTDFNASRSRKSSANSNNNAISPSGSASSFVVRSVVRSPGGVSLPTSPGNDPSHNYFPDNGARQQSPSPAARRMTLEDSDDDEQHQQHHQQLQYRRSKSKPLGAAVSLGVPPGGPGGGVGYGTARSSNDGRPESAAAHQPSPYYRPASPSGSITAGDFQRSAKERGRSPRQSPSAGSGTASDKLRSGSAHSAASSSGKKPVARITAGPKSLVQQKQHDVHHQQQQQQHFHQPRQHPSSRGTSPAATTAGAAPRHAGLSGPRHFPGGPPSASGPAYHSHPQQHPHASNNTGFPLLPPQHAPGHESRDESPSRSRRFSFGISRLRKDSEKGDHPSEMPGAAPLDGLPSPVDIPYGRSPHSPLRFGDGAETDYSRANSPFGSVSPARVAGSPNSSGFLSALMGRQAAEEQQQQQQQRHRDDVPRSCSPGGGSNLAGKWFKGVFGRSPRADEKDPDYAAEPSPFPLTVSGARDAEDEAAYAQKLASMRQARHIVDEERQQYMMGPTTPTGARGGPSGSAQRFDPSHDREFRPRQVVDSDAEGGNADSDADMDAAMELELGRKKSPPGRKPVPAYLPTTATPRREADSQDTATPQQEPLTPAQRIIHETRSKQLAREQIEAQRQQATKQQQQQMAIRNPRETVAANAQINGPPTPPKTQASNEFAAQGHQQRFPSGAHQITREHARGGPPSQSQPPTAAQKASSAAPGPRNASTLSPGSGPMPADMPLRDALQEMMVRFYRFERYSVPLIRSLETRLLDIERDAMLANNPQARNGTRSSTASNTSEEMDRWVNQMTSLMKHEVGQLKAATKELKEARELVATVARHASASGPGVALSMSVSSFGSLAAITPATSVQQMQQPIAEVKPRDTNVSSSTFESAVPRNLNLPAGAKPALGKDEGKHAGGALSSASPTKAIFGFASESAKEHKVSNRDRSVSPNGRPRFTSVLGQPLAAEKQGRLSPVPSSEAMQGHADMPRDNSVENRLKALMSPNGDSIRSRSASFASTSQKGDVESTVDNDVVGKADESGSSDIAAALAAIDASSFAAADAAEDAQPSHEKKSSEHTVRREEEQHHVPISKSSSNSSSNSGSVPGSVEEPLTPTVEVATEPIGQNGHRPKNFSEDSSVTGSVLPYLTRKEVEREPAATSPIKTQFGANLAASPTVASGRISPNKLFAHKFAAAGGSSSSAHSASGSNSPSASAKLGLVERKRFTLPAAPTAAPAPAGTGTVNTIQARQVGRISRTPSYTLEDSSKPASAAFSGLVKKPVGHTATLKERVAFFDTSK